MSETYEVHVSAQHWAEGCDYSISEDAHGSTSCPVYRAMAEAGLPVHSVYQTGWFGPHAGARPLPKRAGEAIGRFDAWRVGEAATPPAPLTFYVRLEA